MSEEKVSLLVQYIVKGQEQMKQIDSDLDKLAAKSETATKATLKGEAASTKNSATLGKQIPILRDLQPLMGGLGLGWLTGAGSIAALGAMAMQANQAFETWMAGMLGYTYQSNLLTTNQKDFNATLTDTEKNAAKLGISTADYTKYMGEFNGVTMNSATSMALLADAVSISHTTGQPLDEVVTALGKAFNEGIVFDGKKISPGIEAVKAAETAMKAAGTTSQGTKNTVNDAWDVMVENITTNVGSTVSIIGTGFKEMGLLAWDMLGIGQDGWLIKGIGTLLLFCEDLDWQQIWSGLGKWWSKTWNAAWEGTKRLWGEIVGFFTNIDWDAVWANLGSAWSRIWRGAINIAIINPINSFLAALNAININLPSWFFGGGHIGFNISPIPQLAKGGKVAGAGSAIVGDNGPELLSLPQGASVTPLSNSGGSTGNQTINLYLADGTMLASWFISELDTKVRLRGGY